MRWRLRMEGYNYQIVYKKGKENAAADVLSRIHPIQEKDLSGESQENPETSKKTDTPEVNDTEKLTSDEDDEPISERLRNQEPKDEKEIHPEYTEWKRNRMPSKLKIKPTTKGKNWIKITKQNIFSMLRIQLPDYDEEKWVKLLYHTSKSKILPETKLGACLNFT